MAGTGARAMAFGGAAAFAASLLYFGWLYARRFGQPAPDSSDILTPLLVNGLLLAVFATHHSAFARSGLKARMARIVPVGAERAAYVWVASLLFAGMAALWQPVPGVLWHVTGAATWVLVALQIVGVLIAVAAARRFDALDLAGVRQVLDGPPRRARLGADGPYALVRHPLYLGILLLVWPVATMTATRAMFVVLLTLYVVIAIPLEERDLRRAWGGAYEDYAARVRSRVIPFVY